jgi:micrococcal nuclease
MRVVRPLGVAALAVAVVVGVRLAGGPSDWGGAAEGVVGVERPAGTQEAVVEKIVDGDTIWVRVDRPGGPLPPGASHKIRLLEIDTPETRHPVVALQCGGPEATAFAQRLLPVGSTVHLLGDREDVDQYGRFLRYVWTSDGVFFNYEAVRTGHARAVLYEPNDAYIDVLRRAEAEARAAKRGLWGACQGARN